MIENRTEPIIPQGIGALQNSTEMKPAEDNQTISLTDVIFNTFDRSATPPPIENMKISGESLPVAQSILGVHVGRYEVKDKTTTIVRDFFLDAASTPDNKTITVQRRKFEGTTLVKESVHTYTATALLGQGGFGTVLEFGTVPGVGSRAKAAAYKEPLKEGDTSASKSAEKHNRLLGDSKTAPHIVPKAKGVLTIDGKQCTWMKNYDGDMSSILDHEFNARGTDFSPAEIRSFIGQLTDAVQYMHHRNFNHGDLKSENIFFTFTPGKNGNEDGTYDLAVADLDGGTFIREDDKPSTSSKTNVHPNDIFVKFHYDEKNQTMEVDRYSDEFKAMTPEDQEKFLKATDVYGLGGIIKELLDPSADFEVDEYGLPYVAPLTEEFCKENNIPMDIKQALDQMLDPDWRKRPSIDQVRKDLGFE